MQEFDAIIRACSSLLRQSPVGYQAKQYLDARLSGKAQEKWGLGYFPDSERLGSLLALVSEDQLLAAKIRYGKFTNNGIYQKIMASSFEQHNLIMPYRDVYGQIIAIVGRTLLSNELQKELEVSKYKNTVFEKGKHVFGLYEARDSILRRDCVFVVEGQFDTMQASDAGIDNIVCVGSSTLTAEQLALIKRYTNNVYLMFDNDESGKKGMERAIEKFGSHANLMSRTVPSGYKDLDEFIIDNKNIGYKDLIAL